jgi:hypothetical protein
MKITIYRNRYISTFFLFLILGNSTLFGRECDDRYFATITQFEYNYKTNTSIVSGKVMESACIGENIEFYFKLFTLDTPEKKEWVELGSGNNILDNELNQNFINYLHGAKSFSFDSPTEGRLIKKWHVLLRSAFIDSDTPSQTLLSLEIYNRIKEKADDYGSLFRIEQRVFSPDELRKSKELSATTDKILLDTILKDNPHPKIFLYQSQDKICYATIEVHRDFGSIQLNDATDEKIKIPYCFDIMYKNSNGFVKTFKKICALETIEIDPEITVNTEHNEIHRFKISCQIIPTEYISDILKLKIEIGGRHVSDKFSGGRTYVYNKEINITNTDVIEIQLPPDWPNTISGASMDPKTLTPVKEEKISSGIKEHSLFIRPVKVE